MRLRIAVWYAIALLLVGYYALFEYNRPASDSGTDAGKRVLVDAEPQEVEELSVRNSQGSGRFRRTGTGWKAVRSSSGAIPSDLIEAIVSNLTAGQQVVVVAPAAPDLRPFGLADPKAEIRLTIKGRPEPVTLFLGNQIPTGTAVYGMIDGAPEIYKIGANIDYYQGQLLFGAESQTGGASAAETSGIQVRP